MIDVVVTLCLLPTADACAERTVPVGESACEAALAAAAPRLAAWSERYAVSEPRCASSPGDATELTRIAPGIYVHGGAVAEPSADNAGDVSNFAVVVGDERVAVIDSGGSREVGERLAAAVRSVTELPVTAIILTHMHPDHVFGATALEDAGAEIVGHHALPAALAARADSYETAFRRELGDAFIGTETPVPTRLVEETATLDLGGRTLRLKAWPMAHTPTDLTVLDDETGILFAGDLVFDRHAPALDGSLPGWQAALGDLDDIAPTGVVPGHGATSLAWPEGGAPLRRYLEVLGRDTRDALDAGRTLSQSVETAARQEAGKWELFDLYNPRNATAAFTELEWE